MRENRQFQELPNPDRKHESWLALKAAYEKYQICFRLMDTMIQQAPEDAMTACEKAHELQQRAFEEYIEARMDYLESCVDHAAAPAMARSLGATIPSSRPGQTKPLGVDWAPFANRVPILRILPIVLLCVTAVSVILEQRNTRQLQTALYDLQTRLDRAREALPSEGPVTNAKSILATSISGEGPHAISSAAGAPKSAVASQSRPAQPPRTAPKKSLPATGLPKIQAGVQREPLGTLAYYPFTLSPSRQNNRIGPVIMTIGAIDPKREWVKLSIASDIVRMDLRLKANQPVWIPVGNRQKPLEFVVDRIGAAGIEGHLAEPRSRNVDMRAGQLTPKSPWRTE